jgi:hypothetical protein
MKSADHGWLLLPAASIGRSSVFTFESDRRVDQSCPTVQGLAGYPDSFRDRIGQ